MQVTDDRDVRRHQRGGIVQRRQVMQVEDVRVSRPGAFQRVGPGVDLVPDRDAVELREHTVGRAGPVLEGGMHRHLRGQRIGTGERGGEVDRADVEAGVEAPRIAGRAEVGARPADDRYVPAEYVELSRHRAADMCGTTAGEELDGRNDTTA